MSLEAGNAGLEQNGGRVNLRRKTTMLHSNFYKHATNNC